MTKAIRIVEGQPETVQGYDSGYLFDVTVIRIEDPEDLFNALSFLADRPSCCVIRGELIDRTKTKRVRRTCRDHVDAPAVFKDVPIEWFALDIDGFDAGADVGLNDHSALLGAVTDKLPRFFRGVTAVVQFTAGHGRDGLARLRIWMLLEDPLPGWKVKAWLTDCAGLVDLSLFSAVQIHYTANPVVAEGADPFPRRLKLCRRGQDRVRVPDFVWDMKASVKRSGGRSGPNLPAMPVGAGKTLEELLAPSAGNPFEWYALWCRLTRCGEGEPHFEGYLEALKIADSFWDLTGAAIGSAVATFGIDVDRDWLAQEVSEALTIGWMRARPNDPDLDRRLEEVADGIDRIIELERAKAEDHVVSLTGERPKGVSVADARADLRSIMRGLK